MTEFRVTVVSPNFNLSYCLRSEGVLKDSESAYSETPCITTCFPNTKARIYVDTNKTPNKATGNVGPVWLTLTQRARLYSFHYAHTHAVVRAVDSQQRSSGLLGMPYKFTDSTERFSAFSSPNRYAFQLLRRPSRSKETLTVEAIHLCIQHDSLGACSSCRYNMSYSTHSTISCKTPGLTDVMHCCAGV
jgi:hypothetical protein